MKGPEPDLGSLPPDWPTRYPGSLDQPAEGDTMRGRFALIRGWAPPVDGLLARVEVSIDGRSLGPARLGLWRPDVEAVSGHPHASVSGFELRIDTTRLAPGPAEISATAVGEGGSRLHLGSVHVTIDEPPPVDRPASASHQPRKGEARAGDGLRLLVVAHDLHYGGAPQFLLDLLRGLSARGVRGRVVSLGAATREAEFEAIRFPVEVVDRPPFHDPGMYRRGVAAIADRIDPGDHDVVLVNTIVSVAGADAALSKGLPVVWAIHESDGTPHLELHAEPYGVHPEVDHRTRAVLRSAHAVVFAEGPTRRAYAEDVDDSAVRMVRYGIPPEMFRHQTLTASRRARRHLGLPSRVTLLLCLGAFEPRKGQTVLVEAFARLVERHPNTALALVGERERSPYGEGLRHYLRRAGLGDRVILAPQTSELARWLDAADVLVSASDLECLPYAVLDAMAAGVPVVGAAVFGVPEVVREGATGFLAEPRDVASLASALDRALEGPRKRRSMARSARRLARRRHDPSLAEARHLEILAEAAGLAPSAWPPDSMDVPNDPVTRR